MVAFRAIGDFLGIYRSGKELVDSIACFTIKLIDWHFYSLPVIGHFSSRNSSGNFFSGPFIARLSFFVNSLNNLITSALNFKLFSARSVVVNLQHYMQYPE
jgi:hypothetical protein